MFIAKNAWPVEWLAHPSRRLAPTLPLNPPAKPPKTGSSHLWPPEHPEPRPRDYLQPGPVAEGKPRSPMTCSEGMGSVEATISLSNPRQPRLHVADDRVMQVPCVARSGWPIRLIVFCGSFGGGWLRALGRGSAGSHAADFWRENRRVGAKRPAKEGLAHDKTVALKAANASCSQGQTRNCPTPPPTPGAKNYQNILVASYSQ